MYTIAAELKSSANRHDSKGPKILMLIHSFTGQKATLKKQERKAAALDMDKSSTLLRCMSEDLGSEDIRYRQFGINIIDVNIV